MGSIPNNSEANLSEQYAFALGDELRGERATLGKSLLDVQRDLRIKAAFIAGIEDLDPAVFPNPAFVPGFVRSYARYLNLVPDEVFARFCDESGFAAEKTAFGNVAAPGAVSPEAVPQSINGSFQPKFPLSGVPAAGFGHIPFSAIGSLLVLVGLVGGLGYGGWVVLQNIQRVQFAPVEQVPVAVADVDMLAEPAAPGLDGPETAALASPVAATALAELYRHQEIEVPILMPRDGPIAALDPDKFGLLAGSAHAAARSDFGPGNRSDLVDGSSQAGMVLASLVNEARNGGDGPAPLGQRVTVLAERAAWVRVYLGNGTIIFEQILEKGETYSLPDGVGGPLIWAGNSGSVYVRVGDDLHGPLGSGTRAVRDIALEPQAIAERYALVEQVPEVISQSMSVHADAGAAPVAIQ
jgi:cytoskeleton protein RodZ